MVSKSSRNILLAISEILAILDWYMMNCVLGTLESNTIYMIYIGISRYLKPCPLPTYFKESLMQAPWIYNLNSSPHKTCCIKNSRLIPPSLYVWDSLHVCIVEEHKSWKLTRSGFPKTKRRQSKHQRKTET